MSSVDFQWPDSAVKRQLRIDAWPDLSVPFRVQVFLFRTTDELRAACGDPLAAAHSISYRKVDREGVGAVIMLTAEELELSLVAHEVTHIALYWWGHRVPKKRTARRVLRKHSERVPEMIGNLTALIWYSLAHEEAGHDER